MGGRCLSKTLLGTNGSGEAGVLGMKKFLLGAAGLVAALSMAAPASAADMSVPYKAAPAMIAAIYDWSGLYIGLNGGGGTSRKGWDISKNLGLAVGPTFPEGCHDASG